MLMRSAGGRHGLSDRLLSKLVEFGLVDARAAVGIRPLSEHLDTWRDSILADGRAKDHADLVRSRAAKVVAGVGAVRFADIDELDVQGWISANTGSVQTRNHYTRAIKQFGAWMVRMRRASVSPVAGLEIISAEADRKHVRRALSVGELQRLLQAAHTGPARGRATGPMRATLYWLASETRLRAADLRSLTRSSFDLDANPPTVTVQAGYSNRRRLDVLALSADLTARLRAELRTKTPAAAAFVVPQKTAAMLRADLERAGIPSVADDGSVFDFHSLRVQCATDLARGGAHPAVAQARMRHSKIDLTMSTYTRLGRGDQAAALDALPRLTIAAGA